MFQTRGFIFRKTVVYAGTVWYVMIRFVCIGISSNFSKWPTWRTIILFCSTFITVLCIINFRFQLNAQYFISIVTFLYMFRAHLCPPSGGPLYIYNIWFYVSLFWWPCSSNCTVTKRDWHRTRCCKYTEVLLRMGTSVPETCRGT